MVNANTLRFLRTFRARRAPTMWLTGLLNFDPEINVHNGQAVTIDIQRLSERLSITQPTRNGGYRDVTSEKFTNKEFVPPVNADSHSLNSWNLLERVPGQNPFDDNDFVSKAMMEASRNMALISDGIARTIELQASQVMQTGEITLNDENGSNVYTINFAPKSTHFPTVTTAWSNTASTPLVDMENLAEVIRADGLSDVTDVIMGRNAARHFQNHPTVRNLLDNRRINIGDIEPRGMGQGATFIGDIQLGTYRVNVWTYAGRYDDPQTGVSTRYIADDNVVMLALGPSNTEGDNTVRTRIDLTYGRHMPIREPLPEARRFIPGGISDGMMRMDMNAWFTDDGHGLTVGAGIRPLVIPVGIDTFGTLDTTP